MCIFPSTMEEKDCFQYPVYPSILSSKALITTFLVPAVHCTLYQRNKNEDCRCFRYIPRWASHCC